MQSSAVNLLIVAINMSIPLQRVDAHCGVLISIKHAFVNELLKLKDLQASRARAQRKCQGSRQSRSHWRGETPRWSVKARVNAGGLA
jgi:hypothetical protein